MSSSREHGHRFRRRGGTSWFADDEGSMALLLMVILVGVSLSALMVPMVITQNRTTRFDATRVQALDAAQAGIDVALGLIRGAVSAAAPNPTYGVSANLPCLPPSTPLVRSVSGVAGPAYSVSIQYYTTDPVAVPASTPMKCLSTYGVYDPSSTSDTPYTPNFAQITSTGTVGTAVNGSSAGRTLKTTYAFKRKDKPIPGGTIQLNLANQSNASTAAECIDAGSAPNVGTAVALQPCSNLTTPGAQQVFSYRNDLTLQLLSSVAGSSQATGICMASSTSPAAVGNTIVLSQCGKLGSAPSTQQWSYNSNGQYQLAGPITAGKMPDLCLTVASQSANTALTLGSCTLAPSWLPSIAVGLGNAAPPTIPTGAGSAPVQLVNYSQFSRCLNVPGASISATHLVSYPCTQSPNLGAAPANQVFTAPPIASASVSALGQIYTTVNGGSTKYCLTSPGTPGGYVTLGPQQGSGGSAPCGSAGATQTWTVYDGDGSLPYATKYTIVDNTGLCLGLTTAASGEAWSAVDVETCTGAADQKWNADPNVLNPALQNTAEPTPTSTSTPAQ